jgi:hypothetical protein
MRNYYATSLATKGDVRGCPSFTVDLTWAFIAIPAPVAVLDTGVTVLANTFTSVAHGLKTGMSVIATTTGIALPDPIALLTEYFVIWIDNDTFKLALTRANAVLPAYVEIDILDQGSAAATITFTAQANEGTVLIERASNPTHATALLVWHTLQTYDIIAVASPQLYAKVDNPYSWIRVTWLPTKGALSSTTNVLGGQSWVK